MTEGDKIAHGNDDGIVTPRVARQAPDKNHDTIKNVVDLLEQQTLEYTKTKCTL